MSGGGDKINDDRGGWGQKPPQDAIKISGGWGQNPPLIIVAGGDKIHLDKPSIYVVVVTKSTTKNLQ
jgi:hypothetical protein